MSGYGLWARISGLPVVIWISISITAQKVGTVLTGSADKKGAEHEESHWSGIFGKIWGNGNHRTLQPIMCITMADCLSGDATHNQLG